MLGRNGMIAASFKPISYRGGASTSGLSTIAKPTGVAAGDIVVLAAANDGGVLGDIATSGGATWSTSALTLPGTSVRGIIWWKVLDAVDVSNAWIAPASGNYRADAWIGYGATTVGLRGTVSMGNATTASFAGYAPLPRSAGALLGLFYFGGSGGTSHPVGFTLRAAASVNNNGALSAYLGDDCPTYAGGSAAFTWASNAFAVGWLLEAI